MSHTLTLRDVPESVVVALRNRARRNRRSMQKEILAILQGAVLDRDSLAAQLSVLRAGTAMTLDEIQSAIEEGRP